MNEYLAMWMNYANFKDRTSVRGYWMAYLVNIIIAFVCGIIVNIIPAFSFVTMVYSLAGLIPGLALTVRRLRDAGFHWAYIFFGLIPLVGTIILIVLLCKKTNNYEGNQV